MNGSHTHIESSPEYQTEQIIGENVLRMVDQLGFTPDLLTTWEIEIDDTEYEVSVKRKQKSQR